MRTFGGCYGFDLAGVPPARGRSRCLTGFGVRLGTACANAPPGTSRAHAAQVVHAAQVKDLQVREVNGHPCSQPRQPATPPCSDVDVLDLSTYTPHYSLIQSLTYSLIKDQVPCR